MITLWLLACQLTATETIGPLDDAAPLAPVEVCRFDFGPAQDADLDDLPDQWTRRKGPGFPRYVKAALDRTAGRNDSYSLRIEANGGAAAYYSPFIRIDGLHTFYFEGYIRTAKLKHDAAMLSVSLLNHRRQRVQRILSRPVLGDEADWEPVSLGPIAPDPEVRFAVIGCHLVPGASDQHDIEGGCWFDDLSLGRLPRLQLESNFLTHFRNEQSSIQVTSQVSGLDGGYDYTLELVMRDLAGEIVDQTTKPLPAQEPQPMSGEVAAPEPIHWSVDKQPPGFYRVEAVLKRGETSITRQRTTLTVLKLVSTSRRAGEFGWSLNRDLPSRLREELPQVAAQSGINWVKYPLWQSLEAERAVQSGDVARMFDRLSVQKIETIGVLDEPPADLRNKFARQWHGVAEAFRLPPSVWRPSVEPVVARYSSNVHHWQVGGDLDTSFLGLPDLPNTVNTVRQEIRRISLNAAVGMPWSGKDPIPDTVRPSFWSVAPPSKSFLQSLSEWTASGGMRWLVIQPAQLNGNTVDERAAQLARQMVAAKISGAPAIFVNDVYHPTHGLLRPNGSPAELFLPWRTYALALQGSEYLGALPLPEGSPNAVFVRDGEAVAVVWNDEATAEDPITEQLYFGEQPHEMDLWGRTKPLLPDPSTGEQKIQVGPIPKLIVGCSEPVAKWRIAAQFEKGKMKSEVGRHEDAVIGRNTFPQGVSGTVSLVLPESWEADPREWTITAATGDTFRFPVYLTAPTNTPLGEHTFAMDFRITADRQYRFRVEKPYTVGLGDVTLEVIDRKLPDGRLEIEQVVSNRTDPVEVLDFRCSLFVPDARRQRLQITKLGQGQDRKFYYLSNAESRRGQSLRLRLEQDGGRRVLNYVWKIGEEW